MTYEVAIERVGPAPMAAVIAKARQDQLARLIPSGLDAVYAALRTGDYGPLGHNCVLYERADDGLLDLRIGVLLDRPFPGVGKVQPYATPTGEAVHVAYFGDYSKMSPAHAAAVDGARRLGRRLARESWEVYGDFISADVPPRTDIYYLLEDAADG